MTETIQQKTVTTRKKHDCLLCGRENLPGSKMVYWAGVYQGEFFCNYTCMTCEEIIKIRNEFEFDEGYTLELCNSYGFYSPEALLKSLRVNPIL